MRGRLQNLRENVSTSLWFVPSVLIVLALILSTILIEVDVALSTRRSPLIPWLFSGTADAARTLLSVISGSLITVISIAFSITILALQQASAQFTPRVLRQFTANRSNQMVLGVYTATFVYALLVLRAVRSADESSDAGFVPALSITVAIGLALVCLGLLIFFVHHMSRSLQIAVIMDHVRHELIEQIDALYPSQLGHSTDQPSPTLIEIAIWDHTLPRTTVHADSAGFIRRIDQQALLNAPLGDVRWLWVRPRVGQFITYGGVLAELDGETPLDDAVADQIRAAFIIDSEPSINQDVLFGVRQLVDIALKALSPGINDMTTAEYALYHLGDALGRLAERPFPASVRRIDGRPTQVIFASPGWDDFVAAAFDQIRHAAEDDVHVTATLLRVLHDLALRLPRGERSRAIQRQVAEVRHRIEAGGCSPTDKAMLRERTDQVEHALQTGRAAWENVTAAR